MLVHGFYHCQFCDLVFENEDQKNAHDYQMHRIFSCVQCKQNFSTHLLLAKHRAERHEIFACNFCHHQFERENFYGHHMKTHRMDPFFFCSPEDYYDVKTEVIQTTNLNMKLKVNQHTLKNLGFYRGAEI